jgi:hypothetical protein
MAMMTLTTRDLSWRMTTFRDRQAQYLPPIVQSCASHGAQLVALLTVYLACKTEPSSDAHSSGHSLCSPESPGARSTRSLSTASSLLRPLSRNRRRRARKKRRGAKVGCSGALALMTCVCGARKSPLLPPTSRHWRSTGYLTYFLSRLHQLQACLWQRFSGKTRRSCAGRAPPRFAIQHP